MFGDSAGGNGVTGNSAGGPGATQNRSAAGFVKAMAYVDPNISSDPIQQCFNSQLSAGQARSGSCGFTYTPNGSAGRYIIDFGFQVTDRFLSATPGAKQVARTLSAGAIPAFSATAAYVDAFDVLDGDFDTTDFYIFVY